MSEERIPKRSEVARENTWAIEDIFATDEAWETALEELKKFPERIASYKGRLAESADTLLGYLKMCDEISVACDALGNYAQRKSDEDTAVAKYQSYTGQLMNVYVAINSAGSFETPELIAIPDETLDGFYKANKDLELYRHHLDRIRLKKEHVLSEAEEKLLAMTGEMGNSAENIYGMFADADLKFDDAVDKDGKAHQVTHGSYIPLVKSTDRVLRKSAFESMYKSYGTFRNTCAATLNAQIKAVNFYSQARKYGSSLEAALSANEVPTEVYTNLIKAVHDNMHYMYDYVALRKKLLGVDELHYYDLYTPIVSDFEMKVTFEEAKETVLKALAPMGEEYLAILREGFENRWIDVYENEGKTSGAYSAGARVHPYVLLNHKDTLDCMFTLAHEMGHAIHSYLSNKNQPVVYSDYVIFVAEVASTCNEALLMQYLLAHTDDKKEKAYLINYFLEQFRTTLYRQTMFAEFELKCNEICASGDSLTADTLCEIYGELNKLYFGDGVVLDEDIKMEWARIPHFYYDYYVYQYATGYSAAIALSQRILKEGAPAVKDYIEGFLSGGCSTDPISLLKRAGVDMSTTKPVTDALALFGDLIKQMDELEG
ncbi:MULTISPECIES: oligoendopeptidase F [Ruminococcus]|uniref:Oligopeptidase F n=1 Tax=Ruminococcus albus 8 TaxID=246199 RepID=E9SAI2_RUMAL|nr:MULTISPECIES: oligoendopeptidase F [Ruminococcus]EGC03643.1 oligoendopeptidase F [Ruminococcus albus 8]MBE6872326.1 oligoendopeptidase F [Ruminococcus albus]MBO5558273.1 oligoendopeptidase F [Ruminococcus sp.]MCC3349817.1 oligoendopeptidase F [Ruminococcus albus 8]